MNGDVKTKSNLIELVYRLAIQRLLGNSQVLGLPDDVEVNILVQDLTQLSLEQQTMLLANASILITSQGSGVVNSMHMPLGSKYCCGVIELASQDSNGAGLGQGKKLDLSNGNVAKRMGFHYRRVNLHVSADSATGNHTSQLQLSTQRLIDAMKYISLKIFSTPTCVLPDVINNIDFID